MGFTLVRNDAGGLVIDAASPQSAGEIGIEPITELLGDDTVQEALEGLAAGSGGGGVSAADLISQAAGKGASMVGIQDAGLHYTGVTVEAALAEAAVATDAAQSTADAAVPSVTLAAVGGALLVGYNPSGTVQSRLATAISDTATALSDAAAAQSTANAAAPSATLAATTLGNGASLIGVHDTGGIITATTVEAALAEIVTKADAAISDAAGAQSDATQALSDAAAAQSTADDAATAAAALGAPIAPGTLGNADVTIDIGDGSEFTMPVATMSTNRSVTIDPTAMTEKEVIRIIRKDLTANTLTIINGGPGAGTLYVFPVSIGRAADFVFDTTSGDVKLAGHVRLA